MVIVIDSQIAGISGDMLLCSLVDLGADKAKIIHAINLAQQHLAGSIINKIEFVKRKKHGISSTCLDLDISENISQRHGTEIKTCLENTIADISMSDKAKKYTISCIDTLILAESKIHDAPIDSVHFHEASSIDTVIDILGTAIALDDLRFFDDDIISTPVAVGGGNVDFSHGVTSNPAFAILEIFKNSNITIHGGTVPDELTTPTGACLLVNLTQKSQEFYPSLQIESVGYGGGSKDFKAFANVLKIIRGKESTLRTDSILVLETNIDDVSGEILGNLIDKLIQNGAKDVTISHAITKKNRPTNLVTILCDDDVLFKMTDILTSETRTLGIRIRRTDRLIQPRMTKTVTLTIQDQQFDVRYKINPATQQMLKIEFEDIKNIADTLKIPLRDAEDLMRNEIKNIGK